MKIITAAKGEEIIVDDEDFERLSKFKWRLIGKGYAARSVYSRGSEVERTNEYMHREILGLRKGDKILADHINGNTLDNRRANLRICSDAENSRNRKIASHNRCGFKGVFWDPRRSKWTAYIRTAGRLTYLGLFITAELAHQAYVEAAKQQHGAFARAG